MGYDQFGLNVAAMLNDPRADFGPKIILEMDGNAIFAHLNDFINLMESPAGFGYTNAEAVKDLLVNVKMTCHRAQWWGTGAPAGTCDEPAYTSEIHPNSLNMLLAHQCARCPKHGGFDLDAAAALALFYRTTDKKGAAR